MIGIERRNEKRAALSASKPSIRPMVMVIPDRDVPGTSASICARPITKPDRIFISCMSLLREKRASAHHNNRPNPMVLKAMTRVSLSADSTQPCNKPPATMAGMLAIIRVSPNFRETSSPLPLPSHGTTIFQISLRKYTNTASKVPR